MKKIIISIIIAVLALFGIVTLFMSSSVIFDLFGIRAKEGNYVPFVVWANWLCGFIYLAAAYGFMKSKRWTSVILGIAVLILIVTYIGLFIYIQCGGIYETKTVYAMGFRTGLTILFSSIAYFLINRKPA